LVGIDSCLIVQFLEEFCRLSMTFCSPFTSLLDFQINR
jgi:hypothetical protein